MGTLWQHRMLLLSARNSPSQERPCRVTQGEGHDGHQGGSSQRGAACSGMQGGFGVRGWRQRRQPRAQRRGATRSCTGMRIASAAG